VARLAELSTTDGLTGTFNHRAFQERLREEFRRAQRYDDALSLVLLDLDHFKDVNDTHGHLVGDAVLREVAAALRGCARDTDFLCRYGGEEFAFLLPRTPLGGALTLAERARQALAALRVGPRGQLRVSASMGLAGLPHRAVHTPEALLQAADEALYRAKAQGRNRVCLAQGRGHPGSTPSVG
jgi:diguanylate cyclase (GGDEF)-like protein